MLNNDDDELSLDMMFHDLIGKRKDNLSKKQKEEE